ncbi:MAG TPA: hypothetical protein VH062_14265 [Polyangiaceae bacterium]|nr:hypothetical protein [Polyangiaceae bacterium]
MTDFAKEFHARFGSMDVLMNIAGISVWGTVGRSSTVTGEASSR